MSQTSNIQKTHLIKHTNFTKALLPFCAFLAVLSSYYLITTSPITVRSFARSSNGPRSINIQTHNNQPTNISHILFGLGGSSNTWAQRRHYADLWWRPNLTRGFVWLDRKPAGPGPWPETSPPYKISSDTARFKYTCGYGSRSAVRVARVVKESFELRLPEVRWFVMGDDDTVFFLDNLVSVLGKYDHEKMYYVGGNSESVEQDVVHSYAMGYGGAGFAISYPLAAELARLLDGCIDRYADLYGSDQKVGACLNEIGVPLTIEYGFHQMDIHGSPYGLLSAHPLAPLVSLHHLDYVDPLFPDTDRVGSVKRLIKAYGSDPARALQHSVCYDPTRNWSISVSWGYAVYLYPFLVRSKELSVPLQTFSTWTWSQGPFTFNTRGLSAKPCERPVVFFFKGVEVEDFGNRSTVSWYERKWDEKTERCEMGNYKAAGLIKGFNVSAGLLHPNALNQKLEAPRRQCCEVVKGDSNQVQDSAVIQVKIRGCDHHESVTPQ